VVFVGQPVHDEEIEAVERGRAQPDPNLPGSSEAAGSGTSAISRRSRPPVARITQARIGWAPGYGMKAGDTICSAPVVGIGTGAPLPAVPTG